MIDVADANIIIIHIITNGSSASSNTSAPSVTAQTNCINLKGWVTAFNIDLKARVVVKCFKVAR